MDNQNNDTKTKSATSEGEKEANNLLNLDTLIKRYLKDINQLKKDLKEQKQMFNDAFENDVKYKETADKAKEINRQKASTKQFVLKDPAVITLSEKVNSIKDEVKDLEDALSAYLREYQRISGANEFETEDGELLEIVHMVKLVKRSSKS